MELKSFYVECSFVFVLKTNIFADITNAGVHKLMKHINYVKYIILFLLFSFGSLSAQNLLEVGEGWANNSVNTTVFRKNSLVTFKKHQFIAYYDADGYLVLGKRKLRGSKWEVKRTQYKGRVHDAHNSISITVDGGGYLHVSWDHHGDPLSYARSVAPLSLELGAKEAMTGIKEEDVTYPEFYQLPDGNLIFMYRDGMSGSGNLVINRYNYRAKRWNQVQNNLLDGENKRNAYWQACVDRKGTIHLAWVWRETWDVASNHDLCYARSHDKGVTWETSMGEDYSLPINAGNAEYALKIPQNSELINQTSISTDRNNRPYIASYWREADSEVPQFHVVYHDGKEWHDMNLGFRQEPFSLSGGGTKRIPISRPQILVKGKGKKAHLTLLFRDEERGSKVSAAQCKDVRSNKWVVTDWTDMSVGSWEPSYDTSLWAKKNRIHIFVQKTEQVDGEGMADIEATPVYVLEVK